MISSSINHYFGACFWISCVHQNPLEGLLNPISLGFFLGVSDLVGLGWDLKICVFQQAPR